MAKHNKKTAKGRTQHPSHRRKPTNANHARGTRKKPTQRRTRIPKNVLSPFGECLKNYAEALANPFVAQPTCVPHSPALPSGKLKCYVKGTLAVGTNGFGYVACGGQFANDAASPGNYRAAYWSTEAFTGVQIYTPSGADVAGTASGNLNSPYPVSGLTVQGVEYRQVALGVRVRYMGKELDRAGRLVAFEHPEHHGLNDYTMSQILAYPETESVGNDADRPWICQTAQPKRAAEFSYRDYSSSGQDNPYLAVVIDGNAGDKWEFEVYSLVETVGPNVTNPTESYADDGMASRISTLVGHYATSSLDVISSMSLGQLDQLGRTILRTAQGATSLFALATSTPLALTY